MRACSLVLVAVLLFLPSCAGWSIPSGYKGPYARIGISGESDGKRASKFSITDVNGQGPPKSQVEYVGPDRKPMLPDGKPARGYDIVIPANSPITLTIEGEHVFTDAGNVTESAYHLGVLTLAPELLYDIVDANRTPKKIGLEGEVSFVPKSGGQYRVKGELGFEQSAIWIEDEGTGRRIVEMTSTPETRIPND